MEPVTNTQDVAGTDIQAGDTVAAVNGQSSGKVTEIAREDDVDFVRLRPAHLSYGKGVWYAADQVFWLARPGSAKKTDAKPKAKPAASPASSAATSGATSGGRSGPAKKK